MLSQKQQILEHLLGGRGLTPAEAFHEYDIFRLAARIADLRKDGHTIRTEYRTNGERKRWACYYLQEPEQGLLL